MTHHPEHITDDERAEAFRLIHLAICDPGAYVKREHDDGHGSESVTHWGARAVVAALDAHPLLEVRRYHPTASAYEAADKAVWKHRERADQAEAERDRLADKLGQVRAKHGRPRTDRYGSGCIHCGILWPCPTYRLVTDEAEVERRRADLKEGDRD